MREKLLSRLDKPVFAPRPIPELFDAVDPTADTGGGIASYSLQLDRKCHWRLAGLDDRRDVDFATNARASNDHMRWLSYEPGQKVTWKPISLTKKSSRVVVVSSFDIAVVLENKKQVVVFRNQNHWVGESRQQVISQARNYVNKSLGLQIQTSEDAISVHEEGGQFSGILLYSYLADLVKPNNTGSDKDLQLYSLQEFQDQKVKEDNQIK